MAGQDLGLSVISGVNTIPAFVAVNHGFEAISALYQVTPVNEYGVAGVSQNFTITVNPKLAIGNMSDTDLFLCKNENLSLFVEVKGNAEYQWYYEGNVIPGATQASYETIFDASKAGVYSLTISNECGNTTYFFNVQLNPIIIEVKHHDALYVDNTGNKYVAYQWYKNGQPISQYGTSQYYTEPGGFTPNAEYNLKAYKADGSYDEACPIIPNDGSNTNTLFKVYPNPATNGSIITILLKPWDDEQPDATAYIFDVTGRIVKSFKITNYKTEIAVDFAVASYLVKVITKDSKEFVEKIIITK